MRCECCNVRLTDYETSLKSPATGSYWDSCVKCLKETGLSYVGNTALEPLLKEEKEEDEPDDAEEE